jgi:hypothetical protein
VLEHDPPLVLVPQGLDAFPSHAAVSADEATRFDCLAGDVVQALLGRCRDAGQANAAAFKVKLGEFYDIAAKLVVIVTNVN